MKKSAKNLAGDIAVLVADSNRMGCQLLASALKHRPYHFNVITYAVTSAEILNAVKKQAPHVA